MTLQEAIATNLRVMRAVRRIKQDDAAQHMRKLGFTTWTRATVSLAEQGKRRVTAEEVFGLADVFETNVVRLLDIRHDSPVFFPGGTAAVQRRLAP